MKNRKGGKMAIITLDDFSGRIEVTVFTDVFQARLHLIKKR